MTRGTGTTIAWIAREMIYVGQTIIRIGYGWLKWSERK